MMTIFNKSVRTFVATSLLSIAGVAVAAATENAPGAYCVPVAGGALTVRDDGEVENRSASVVTVVCPVERDPSSISISGLVFVVDQNPSANVCCHVASKNPGGGLVTRSDVCSTGNNPDQQHFDIPEITDKASWSHFFVTCTIPPANNNAASRIQMYRTTQK